MNHAGDGGQQVMTFASHGARTIPDVRKMTPSSDIIPSPPGNFINCISRQYIIRKLVVRGQGAEGGV